jgi:hypothetical protein
MHGQNITFVTAASSNHYRTLLQFLRSVPSSYRTIVYDIGLSEQEANALPTNILYRKFDFSPYPEFVRLTSPDAGAYVWKPCIVNDVCKEFEGIVVWCDSGNILTNPNLLIQSAVTCGVYSGISSGSFLTWTHETARQHLPNSNRFLGNQMRNAACIAIDWSNPKARDLICEWKGYALRQEISLPPGASRSNHRHDQSILTYLIYSYQLPRIDHQTGYTIHNDID